MIETIVENMYFQDSKQSDKFNLLKHEAENMANDLNEAKDCYKK